MNQRPAIPRNFDLPIRFAIGLLIYSGDIPPNQVSERLGMDATSAVSREPMAGPLRTHNFRLGKLNGWFLESEVPVDSREPRDHIDWFVQQIPKLQPGLAALLKEPGVQARVSIHIWSDSGGANLSLTPADINGFFALGLPVDFAFVDYPDEKTEE
ncbi:MAG: DUF4279 domain-containing protein [Acidobacteriia bacterium]|nr:DUF4279 domain-containing protein [Terriglobia bacterium]